MSEATDIKAKAEIKITRIAPLCVKREKAMKLLCIGQTSFYKRCNKPKSDPTRINKNSDNTFAIEELQRHLRADREAILAKAM